ncbi:hypothetical protein VPH35_029021 [Triticum aestivum]|uniref:Peroxidase n=2 Tax=Triticum TaxID=4564 RepID=A0A9R1PPC1_TRITD|nr:peroxidase 1-like [Triticum aestivum]VAH46714.1 unnamed protein product [Triticum turgidum subsp. durum]
MARRQRVEAREMAALVTRLSLALAALLSGCAAQPGIRFGYYDKTCPGAERIVFRETTRIVRASPDLAASLLRLHYHDCFVQGCDASVLLDSADGSPTEKDAIPNESLRGFDAVARVKDKLEKACPATVSCADLLALMARDAVVLSKGPSWPVALGRRDGRTSRAENCGELPPLYGNITVMIEVFAAKGLDVKDLVVLSAGHTLGKAHCSSFADRLYNGSIRSTDPTLDGRYADRLRMRCRGPSDSSAAAEMDAGSCGTFDTSYYRQVARRRGLLRSDAGLMEHPFAGAYVRRAATGRYDGEFFRDFRVSMAKMGAIGVLTGNQGKIRTKCNLVN